jgi:hypothetical protein
MKRTRDTGSDFFFLKTCGKEEVFFFVSIPNNGFGEEDNQKDVVKDLVEESTQDGVIEIL